MSGGGGGGGGGMPKSPNIPAAGPPRDISSYPQYNPFAYLGMTPGANPGLPGVGAPIQSYMPAVNGMNGFGGIPANQLVQALMAGYAGVPSPVQATGANAPGMGTMTPTAGTTTTPPPAQTNPHRPGSREWRRWEREHSGRGAVAEGSMFGGGAYGSGGWSYGEGAGGDAGADTAG